MESAKPASSLNLTRSEVTQCKHVSESGELNGQRAKALLAIHQGNTQAVAAAMSGLSLGQVRYIIRRFRIHRIKSLQVEASVPSVSKPADKKAKAKPEKKKEKKKLKGKKGRKDKTKNKGDKKTKSDKKVKKEKKKGKKAKK
jgi:hypothetical protein